MSAKRNLLIILAHGLRSDALGDGSAWPLTTPHIDDLARAGLRLTAMAACPADPGAAISLYSGLHARQHGHVGQNSATVTCGGWAAALAADGYHLAGVGRIDPIRKHLHEAVAVHDVASRDFANCQYLRATRSRGITAALLQQRQQRNRTGPFEPARLIIEPGDDVDGYIATRAAEMLGQLPADRPWALIVAFTGPANELPPPTISHEIVDTAALVDGFIPVDFRRIDCLAELDHPRALLQRLTPTQLARIRADYLGRVSLLDFSIGRLRAAACDRKDADRTWTVLTSDRGYLLGEHGLVGHRAFLAGAVDVPLIIAAPKAMNLPSPRGLQIGTVDVAATLSDLGGTELPQAAVGRSLLCLMRGQPFRTLTAGGCLSEFSDRLCLRTERYKAAFRIDSQMPLMLFDTLHDADELDNLIGTARGQSLLDSVRWRLGDALMPLRSCPIPPR